MSQGLAQYENTLGGFGNAADSIRSYTATYDTDFFRDWTEKHNLAMEKLKSIQDVTGGVGGAYIAGKLGIAAFRKRQAAKKKNDGDEDGDEVPDEDEEQFEGFGEDAGGEAATTSAAPAAGAGAEEEFEGFGEDTEDVSSFLGNAGSTTTESGFTLARDTADAADAGDVGDGASAAASTATAGGTEAATAAVAPEIGAPITGTATLTPLGSTGAPSTPEELARSTFDNSDGDLATGADAAAPEATVTAGTDAGASAGASAGADAGASGGADAAAALASGAEGAVASGLGDAALTIAAGAAEAIPFLGIFASVGIGLYELFHHPHKPPAQAAPATASSKGEMVLPSFDSVTDTPASQGAF